MRPRVWQRGGPKGGPGDAKGVCQKGGGQRGVPKGVVRAKRGGQRGENDGLFAPSAFALKKLPRVRLDAAALFCFQM